MATLWTRSYGTGETICAVCGAPKGNKKNCCRVAPKIDFETFVKRYFGKDYDLSDYGNANIAREFYSDYRHSDCKSLKQYIAQTTSTM